jgi:uncharacterized membrane protein
MKRNLVIIACFFLSGATALIYEVLWTRMLALTFGNTVYAIGIVLMAFIGRTKGRTCSRDTAFLKYLSEYPHLLLRPC